MSRAIPIEVRKEAHRRVSAVLRCLAVLVPDATPRQRKRLANKILTLADGKDRSLRISRRSGPVGTWLCAANACNGIAPCCCSPNHWCAS